MASNTEQLTRLSRSTGAPNLSHARALRVIGQLIEGFSSSSYDVEFDDDNYHICVISPPTRFYTLFARSGASFRGWSRQRLLGQPGSLALTRSCSLDDIEALDTTAKSNRQGWNGIGDPLGTSEWLRALGGHLDKKSLRLRRVSRQNERILVTYETTSGSIGIEEHLLTWARNQAVAMRLATPGRRLDASHAPRRPFRVRSQRTGSAVNAVIAHRS